ncbi:serine protease 1 [Umbelopsis sp. PMI_123]|nr:serine protease 1 [Umbelopsis sp. PMI_123]
MVKTTFIAAAVALLSTYVAAVPVMDYSFDTGRLAPLYIADDAEALADSYIVVLKDHVDSENAMQHCHWVRALHNENNFMSNLLDSNAAHGIKHAFDLPKLKGYSGKFSKETLEKIRQSDDVAYIERDTVVYASELERNAPWGLARVSHREPLNLRTFSKYNYEPEGGDGVKVFVIDTGINVKHVDFGGRAEWGATIPDGDADEDGNGHGSHCAGTIAGKRYGVAKKAKPVAVKVLRSNGSGSMSDVVKGVEWATEQHLIDQDAAQKANKKYKGAVANMSLGGGKSRALDDAVDGAVEEGIVFAVAAGNDNRDACNYSPAASPLAITVGASTITDERAYFSNFGKCVDVFAPGLDITSIWIGSDHATNKISGTSMASPHVAGLAAYFLSLTEEKVTPKQIKDQILELATKNALATLPKDTVNLLIFNNYTSTGLF